ncbi:MAG: hypothetical protein D6808_07115 [Candidatus Dadabacteria bacterium]|nr:MAG: hypothetical protein D6808_07115 [Candidatus Dadabacteria bacterium]
MKSKTNNCGSIFIELAAVVSLLAITVVSAGIVNIQSHGTEISSYEKKHKALLLLQKSFKSSQSGQQLNTAKLIQKLQSVLVVLSQLHPAPAYSEARFLTLEENPSTHIISWSQKASASLQTGPNGQLNFGTPNVSVPAPCTSWFNLSQINPIALSGNNIVERLSNSFVCITWPNIVSSSENIIILPAT